MAICDLLRRIHNVRDTLGLEERLVGRRAGTSDVQLRRHLVELTAHGFGAWGTGGWGTGRTGVGD